MDVQHGSARLRILVARAAGTPLDTFLRERLFGPLGMSDTDFHVPAAKLSRFTTSYLADPETGALSLYDSPEGGQWSKRPAHASAAEGLVSTAPDFFRFSTMMLDGGVFEKKRILSEASVKQMTTDALTPENKAFGAMVPHFFDTRGWGLGIGVVTKKDELGMPVGAFGWDGGLGSSWFADPHTKTTGILLSNRSFTNPDPPVMFKEFWRQVNGVHG